MYLTQVLDDLSRPGLIDLFGLSAVLNVEAALTEKSGKPSRAKRASISRRAGSSTCA